MADRPVDRDVVYPVLSGLHAAVLHALEGARKRRGDGLRGDYSAPWLALVSGLADLFENVGGRVTAAKGLRDCSYAKPSPFVELIWGVMTVAIPEDLREYTSSKGAMAGAVSRALSGRDAT
jgi:hypothetical protein